MKNLKIINKGNVYMCGMRYNASSDSQYLMYLQDCTFIIIFILCCWFNWSLDTDVYLAHMRYTRYFSDFDLPWVQRLTVITNVNTLDCEAETILWENIMTAWLYYVSLKSPVYSSTMIVAGQKSVISCSGNTAVRFVFFKTAFNIVSSQ